MQVNAWSKHEIFCTPMSHLNFSFLMIIVIWLVYSVPLVDSWVTSQQEDYETTSWPRLAILVSFKNTYVLCHLSFRFNNSNLDTKCTFLAVCRAALQFFFIYQVSFSWEWRTSSSVQWNCSTWWTNRRFKGGNHTNSWKAARLVLYD